MLDIVSHNQDVDRPKLRSRTGQKARRRSRAASATSPSPGPINSTQPNTELSPSKPATASTAVPGLTAQAVAIADQYKAERQAIAPKDRGRLSELADKDTLDKLFTALADGNYPSAAAVAAGIDRGTFDRWMKRAEDEPTSAYATFAAAVKEAEAQAESAIVAKVRSAANLPQFWAAGMTLLERRHPEKWGKRNEADQGGPRVVVQIGVKDGDVQIATGPTPTQAVVSRISSTE